MQRNRLYSKDQDFQVWHAWHAGARKDLIIPTAFVASGSAYETAKLMLIIGVVK